MSRAAGWSLATAVMAQNTFSKYTMPSQSQAIMTSKVTYGEVVKEWRQVYQDPTLLLTKSKIFP